VSAWTGSTGCGSATGRTTGYRSSRTRVTDEGAFLKEIPGLLQPDTIYFDPRADVLYLAELQQRVSILTLDGEVVTQWGGGRKSGTPGEFLACPHGIWADSRGDLYVSEVQADGRLQKFIRV
jgi:sugar lactone lactonase YvrE